MFADSIARDRTIDTPNHSDVPLRRIQRWSRALVLRLVAATFLSGSLNAASSAAANPCAVVAFSSFDKLQSRAREFFRDDATPELPDLARRLRILEGGLPGVDRSRPWGIVYIAPRSGWTPESTLYLPADDAQGLIESLQAAAFGEWKSLEDGRWTFEFRRRTITVSSGPRGVALSTLGATVDVEHGLARLADELNGSDVSMRLVVDALPSDAKPVALAALSAAAVYEQERESDAPPEEAEIRRKVAQQAFELARMWVRETESLRLAVRLDDGLHLWLDWNATPESRLASEMAALAVETDSSWEAPGETAALELQVAVRPPEGVRKTLEDVFRVVRRKLGRDVGDQLDKNDRAPAGGVFDSIRSTLEAGVYATRFQFLPNENGSMVFISTTLVEGTSGLMQTLDTLAPYIAQLPEVADVQRDALESEHLRLHRVKFTKVRRSDQRLYGPAAGAYVGATENAFVFAVGDSNAPAVLETLRPQVRQHPPLVQLRVRPELWRTQVGLAHAQDSWAQSLLQVFPADTPSVPAELSVTAGERSMQAQLHLSPAYIRWILQATR